MDLQQLQTLPYTLLDEQVVENQLLQVKETELYRWFELAGSNPQSVMSKKQPHKILTPVYQTLLLFLLVKQGHLDLLNLGLGGGSLERFLAQYSQIKMSAVDASKAVIDIAKKYFQLPEQVHLFCQPAQRYLNAINHQYDVIICDLFVGKHNASCLQEETFYQQLKKVSKLDSLLMLNLRPESDQQLLQQLLMIKGFFPYLLLFEFSDYANVVVMASQQALPNQSLLQQRLAEYPELLSTGVEQALEKMHVIPHN